MDKVDCAARILVRAFGYGRAWDTRHARGEHRWQPGTEVTAELSLDGEFGDGESSAMSDALPVCREAETLQRAGESVSAWLGRPHAQTLTRDQCRACAKLTPEQQKSLWAWERANSLHKGQQHNPHRPREFEHWKRMHSGSGVQVVRPLHTMDQYAIEALVGIPRPLQSTLLLYALQDGCYWPTVERYARATLPASTHAGIAEGMYRLLKVPSKRTRAKELHMRESDWAAMSYPALDLFESWVERAATTFLQQLDRAAPIAGTQSKAHTSETWWRPIEQSADVRGGSPAS